jgi:fumarate reductase flavoprotein subunit
MPKINFTRREFLRDAAIAGVGVAAGSLIQASPVAAQGVPTTWDKEADVVVIGAGCMGYPAAIIAQEAGSAVILVEAQKDIGGHAITSGGNVPLAVERALKKRPASTTRRISSSRT